MHGIHDSGPATNGAFPGCCKDPAETMAGCGLMMEKMIAHCGPTMEKLMARFGAKPSDGPSGDSETHE